MVYLLTLALVLTLTTAYSRWHNHSRCHYRYIVKYIHVHNMGTDILCYSFVHNIQVYKLNKRKKNLKNVNLKGQLVDNIRSFMYLITYVNISFERCPKRKGNSMFRFYCKKVHQSDGI